MGEGVSIPGGWFVDRKDPSRIRHEEHGLIAIVVTRADIAATGDRERQYERERAAIARVIAAAPEMLAAQDLPEGGAEAREMAGRVLARVQGA